MEWGPGARLKTVRFMQVVLGSEVPQNHQALRHCFTLSIVSSGNCLMAAPWFHHGFTIFVNIIKAILCSVAVARKAQNFLLPFTSKTAFFI